MSSASPQTTSSDRPSSALERAIAAGVIVLGDTRPGHSRGRGGDPTLALPASDRGVVGVAVGMSLAGPAVIVELADTSRLAAVADLLGEAGRLAASNQGFSPRLVLRVPYADAAHAAIAGVDRALGEVLPMAPGLRVWCASSPAHAGALLAAAVDQPGVTVLLEGRAAPVAPAAPAAPAAVVERRPGAHVTVAAWGRGVQAALDAAEALVSDGIDAQVIDVAQLLPADAAALGAFVRRTGRLVVAHPSDPALADHLVAACVQAAFLHWEAPPATAVATPDAIAKAARDAVFY
jgi:pyruvate/2-oxoglutarate/acetoin dehydrogenase E1 component